MTIGTAQRVAQTQAPGSIITVALVPAAWSGLGRLQEHTGLSQGDLANCAITWYAYFDAQLRAGYNLTLWSEEKGKAYTLSLSAGSAAAAGNVRWVRGEGETRGAEGGGPAAPSFYFKAAQLSAAQASQARYGLLPGPAATALSPWLTVATSRGSPAAAPGAGAPIQCAHPVSGLPARQLAVPSRNGGS